MCGLHLPKNSIHWSELGIVPPHPSSFRLTVPTGANVHGAELARRKRSGADAATSGAGDRDVP